MAIYYDDLVLAGFHYKGLSFGQRTGNYADDVLYSGSLIQVAPPPPSPTTLTDYQVWLSADNQTRIILVEVQAYHSGGVVTRYLSDGDFVSQPSDTPANTSYTDGIVTGTPQFSAHMSEVFSGQSTPVWGDLEIQNFNGELDSWLDDGWDGRTISIYLGDPTWSKSQFELIMVGTVDDIYAKDQRTLALKVRDKQWTLNVPVQTNLIGGSTANANSEKPLCYGPSNNVEPVLIDSALGKYQVHDGAINAISDVRDNGVSLIVTGITISAVDTSTETMTASAAHGFSVSTRVVFDATPPTGLTAGTTYWVISAGLTSTAFRVSTSDGGSAVNLTSSTTGAAITGYKWNVDLSAGTFTLVEAPAGRITADVQGAKPGGSYLVKCADIMSHLITTHTSLTSADLDAASFAAFNTTCPQTMNLYVRTRENLIDVLDNLITSLGGWYSFSRAGLLQLGRLDPPSGTAMAEFTADDVGEGTLRVTRRITPIATVLLGYKKNWTVQTDGLAGAVSEANRALYAAEYLVAKATDPAILEAHPLAPQPALKGTLIALEADATAEAERQLALFGPGRKVLSAEGFAVPFSTKLGQVVNLTNPNFGFSAGGKAVVVGLTETPTRGRVEPELFV